MSKPWLQLQALSPSEQIVCERLAQGIEYKQIAHEMGITENTAQHHGKAALRKLGLSTSRALPFVWPALLILLEWCVTPGVTEKNGHGPFSQPASS